MFCGLKNERLYNGPNELESQLGKTQEKHEAVCKCHLDGTVRRLAFVSGFKVNQKFVPPPVAASNLAPCGQVTDPSLSACGSDPLDQGLYEVNRQGQLTVKLNGASPSTNYEVFFRPIDNSGDTDTGVAVPTNALGNATVANKKVFSSGTVAAGSFVLKEQIDETHDQFVAGFNIH